MNLNYLDGTKGIGEYIYEEIIVKNDLLNDNNENQLKNLELLVDCGYAMKLESRIYVYDKTYHGSNPPQFCFMSYYMMKHNSDLKDLNRVDKVKNVSPFKSKKVEKIFNCQLSKGTHYVRLGKNRFLSLYINTITYGTNGESEEEDGIFSALYFIGKKCKKDAEKYMKEYEEFLSLWKKENNKIFVYQNMRKGESRVFKTFDQYIFTGKEKLIEYVEHWKKNIPLYYEKYNMTPKLSILLYGKPGTGKSTFYQCLSRYLDFENISLVDTSNIFDNVQKTGFYVIDEIDLFCLKRKKSDNENTEETFNKENSIMLQKLLAFLDNPPTFDYKLDSGQTYPVSVVVATTNFYDRLDDAVKRYGRFDLQLELKDFNRNEADQMCSLYDLRLEDVVHKGINKPEFRISPAKLQALCLENIDNTLKGKKGE